MRRARCVIGALLGVLWVAPLGAQQATGTVRGRVTDATTQQPLVGASVSLGTRRVLSQGDGRYVVITMIVLGLLLYSLLGAH